MEEVKLSNKEIADKIAEDFDSYLTEKGTAFIGKIIIDFNIGRIKAKNLFDVAKTLYEGKGV